jgi:hypothetical protein
VLRTKEWPSFSLILKSSTNKCLKIWILS